ncbi:hypothetical protein [Streptomyces flaveus]|uniref:hypothetical protein n=1 Tax=Streptomyces flaveus TaxID=66370 RepID=UPI0033234E30
MSSRTDRRNWVWLPSRLRFRVLGLIDVVALWVVVSALVGAGAWWGLDAYRDNRDYCTENQELRRVGDECIGVTASAYPFAPDLTDVLGKIEKENEAALHSRKQVVSVAVVMPYTQETEGAAVSESLIRRSLQGAYVAQRDNNQDSDTAIRLLFANVGENLNHWRTVTDELKSRVKGQVPLVAAIGFPNSNDETLDSVKQGLGRYDIPAVSAVLSSREMEDPHLFKVSPSTDHLVDALKRYVNVKANRVNRADTFMIADDQKSDNYVNNLRKVFFAEFGEEYGIDDGAVDSRIATYLGQQGSAEGEKRKFRQAVTRMCAARAKTVFLAGRDVDLPPFLTAIGREPSCDQGTDDEPLRILRVSTGRDPVTEKPLMRDIAERKHVEIVTAAAVDAPRWRAGSSGDNQVPQYFSGFARSYEEYFDEEQDNALNDGYAVMYHDALTAVGRAVTEAETNGVDPIRHRDIYDELSRLNTSEGCVGGCVPGASGVFAFANENIKLDKEQEEAVIGRWPVCKPVPVVTFPEERQDKSPLYRTYQGRGEACPGP